MKENIDSGSYKLSKKRTLLAAERTALSYVRTCLVCFSVALTLLKIDTTRPVDGYIVVMIVLSFLSLVGAVLTLVINREFIHKVEQEKGDLWNEVQKTKKY